ncbi:MAG: 3-hydroxyacyl-CoA dehydrogenase NAD-binding domain-containing protein [Candidatus Doudnabacteria bacterium]|nr:3-hydroxyacyl-CoA dehydrogenase NAD-binding domain-containing protein [bacterium]MDZ4243740.1 3-hydroxyacyl-CoA dehydrogenase NAD-binding domain-containing protein [Candidatus Doudnabacteria bacterium]
MKVKIFGAGSIGNHLTQASRRKGWDVTVVDIDPAALKRMKEEIYPKRYGSWDPQIKLMTPEEAPKGGFDVIMVGTPPPARLKVAMEALEGKPRVLQLEKPYFVPMLDESLKRENQEFMEKAKSLGIKVVVGYEYALGESAKKALDFISDKGFGKIRVLEVAVREEWSGALAAHPWLKGPADTYLGFWQKGGGALSEHSHAIHYWQHFASHLGLGTIDEVSASMRMVKDALLDYDELTYLNIKTDQSFTGTIVQDVVTDPPYLSLFIQREKAFVKWLRRSVPGKGNVETITYGKKDENGWLVTTEDIPVARPDDFYPEINHIADLLEEKVKIEDSPIRLEMGAHVTAVVTAAHESRLNNGKFIKVTKYAGYR